MRYIVFILIGAVSVILSGSIFGIAQIAGIAPDIILICTAAIILMERSVFPIIFAAVWGLVYDIMYSTVLGVNAFSYTVAAIAMIALLKKYSRITL